MNYIDETYNHFRKHFSIKTIVPYKDDVGTHCIEFLYFGKSHLFVAKNSQLGEIVSVHKNIVMLSATKGFKIVMCLKGEYYKILGSVILASKTYENVYNGATMINFTLAGAKAERIPLPGEANPVATFIPKTVDQFNLLFEGGK